MARYLVLDETTRRNLELFVSGPQRRRQGTLLWHLNRCRTSMGSRLLTQWLLFALRDPEAIARRADAVEHFKVQRAKREALHKVLGTVLDLERLAGRVALGRATPRDLGALLQTLRQVPALRAAVLDGLPAAGQPGLQRWQRLDIATDVADVLQTALADELPVVANEGGIFCVGYKKDLDELIALSTQGHSYLTDLEARERTRTGVASLKVRYNRVFGYFIEVTRANLPQVPSDYIRKQTLVNAERFVTPELKEFEEKVIDADGRRRTREAQLFAELVQMVAAHVPRLRALGREIAQIDVLAALAEVAEVGRYTRPQLSGEPILHLTQSRHPVLERLMPGGERFVPQDMHLDAQTQQLMVVTGPNMAGKSTAMRQAALCVILAQMGSFVPARAATIGLCDRIFTRVGAADNLGRGQSTFMVEMVETATILRCATAQSLVLLDEIGRGTSTFDGVSIAWAVAEHLHDSIGCRGMFATHYHELTALADTHPRIFNTSVAIAHEGDRLIFLRHLVPGGASRSYGLEVARMAALPGRVVARARQILRALETPRGGITAAQAARTAAVEQATLHGQVSGDAQRPEAEGSTRTVAGATRPAASVQSGAALSAAPEDAASAVHPILEAVEKLDVNSMTPLEALSTLAGLQKQLRDSVPGAKRSWRGAGGAAGLADDAAGAPA
jgi:DNA mismatch repair protein MutS